MLNKGNKKVNKGLIYFLAFGIPFALMQIFWIMCGIYPFGDNSILVGDMDLEFVNFYAYFRNLFKSSNGFSYMFAKTLGGDYPGLAAFQLHDPLLFVLFLFPGEKIAAGVELVLTLQISIAGLSASVLLNNRYRASWMSLLFSTAYSFCAFFFGYLILTIYFGCLAVMPLIIYFFLGYLDDDKYLVPYVLSTVYCIFVNFHMGFMLVIFLVLLYMSRIIADTAYVRRLKAFVISGITILLIDGFFLIRTGLSLIGEKTTKTADYGFYRRFPLSQLFANLFSGTARNDLRPLIYCSVAVFFFAILYFASGKYRLREKLANLFMLAAIIVSMWINLFDTVWHGFNNPEGFYWRYAHYVSLILITLGYKGFIAVTERSEDEEEGSHTSKKRRVALVSAAPLIMILYMIWLKIMGNIYMDTERFFVNIVLVIVIFASAVMCMGNGKLRMAGCAMLMLVSVPDMLYSSRLSYIGLIANCGGEAPAMSRFKDDYRNIDSAISYIKSEDDGFYRIEKDFDRAVNDPAMFDYMGLSHDSSCEKDEIINWLMNFGFCKTVYYTYYNGGSTSFVDALFGVRYFVSRFDGVEKPYTHMPYEGFYHVFENEYALPMIFRDPAGLKDFAFGEGNTFEKQNMIAGYWNSGDEIYKKAEYRVSLNGAYEAEPGHYVRTEDEGSVIYEITSDGEMPIYMFFAAPERQNGEVFVNGESRGPYFTEKHWNVLCAGRYKKGDTVEIRIQIPDEELYIDEACFYYEDKTALAKWSEAAGEMNKGVGAVEKVSGSHLRFKTDMVSDGTLIMTIPFDKCWKVSCDGRKMKPEKAMGMLMGIKIPEGEHLIEMKYTPRGTLPGAIASAVGIVLFALQIRGVRCRRECRE